MLSVSFHIQSDAETGYVGVWMACNLTFSVFVNRGVLLVSGAHVVQRSLPGVLFFPGWSMDAVQSGRWGVSYTWL